MKYLAFQLGILSIGLGLWVFAEFFSGLGYIALLIIVPVALIAAGIMIHLDSESEKWK